MPIPHLPEVRSALLDLLLELEEAGVVARRKEVIEKLAQRFQLTMAEREVRDPTEARTFDHAVDSAVANLREVGWIEPPEKSGRAIWKLSLVAIEDLRGSVATLKVKSAEEATEIARTFIKKHRVIALPVKAIKEDNVWSVDIDVGPLAVKIAKVKIDAKTGGIISYEIPEFPPI